MSHYLENESIAMGFADGQTQNNYDVFIHILEADLVTRPGLRLQKELQTELQLVGCGICWLLLLIGSYFRYILYMYLIEKYKIKESKPIDVLILVVSITQHVRVVVLTLRVTMIVSTGTLLEYIPGPWFCTFSRLVFQFEHSYSCIGSLVISIYRILYIKQDQWVKYSIGQKNLLCVILFGGVALSASVVLLLNTILANISQVFGDAWLCMVVPDIESLQILDAYEKSRGNASIYSYWSDVRTILGFILMSVTIAEITIYFIFFHHIYRHDNNQRLARLLEPNVIKLRNRMNAITFFGQFCSFVFEFTLGIIIICAIKGYAPFWIVFSLKGIIFSSMAMVEVLTSHSLRPRIFRH